MRIGILAHAHTCTHSTGRWGWPSSSAHWQTWEQGMNFSPSFTLHGCHWLLGTMTSPLQVKLELVEEEEVPPGRENTVWSYLLAWSGSSVVVMCFTSSVALLAMCSLSYILLVTCRSLLSLVILWQVRKQTRTSARPSRLTRKRQGHSLETFSKWLLMAYTHTQLPACPYIRHAVSQFVPMGGRIITWSMKSGKMMNVCKG